MKQAIIIANWKMNITTSEAGKFINELKKKPISKNCQVIIAAPYTLLPTVSAKILKAKIKVAAQNMFYEEQGAFTGEISPLQIKDVGCKYVIIGHSERRQIFKENNALLNRKLMAAQKNSLTPIYCIGETLHERKANQTKKIIKTQIEQGLSGLSQDFMRKVIIAYEPIWAIGTGETATPEQAEEMHQYIRTLVSEQTKIIYGGSVKPENAKGLFQQPLIDGFLVGSASLEVDDFYKIILACK